MKTVQIKSIIDVYIKKNSQYIGDIYFDKEIDDFTKGKYLCYLDSIIENINRKFDISMSPLSYLQISFPKKIVFIGGVNDKKTIYINISKPKIFIKDFVLQYSIYLYNNMLSLKNEELEAKMNNFFSKQMAVVEDEYNNIVDLFKNMFFNYIFNQDKLNPSVLKEFDSILDYYISIVDGDTKNIYNMIALTDKEKSIIKRFEKKYIKAMDHEKTVKDIEEDIDIDIDIDIESTIDITNINIHNIAEYYTYSKEQLKLMMDEYNSLCDEINKCEDRKEKERLIKKCKALYKEYEMLQKYTLILESREIYKNQEFQYVCSIIKDKKDMDRRILANEHIPEYETKQFNEKMKVFKEKYSYNVITYSSWLKILNEKTRAKMKNNKTYGKNLLSNSRTKLYEKNKDELIK